MNRKRIEQSNLTEGMTIAIDIISPDGIFLISKDTLLTPAHITKINNHMILDEIYISTDQPSTDENLEIPITETAAFIEFSFKYDQQVQEVGEQLSHIVATGSIPKDALDNIVVDIMDTANSESHLFSYMCRLTAADDVTYNHSMNVSLLAGIFGKWLNYSQNKIKELALAGLLHDIGKIRINADILNKTTRLSDSEFDYLKQHTTLGYEILAKSDLSLGIKQSALMHHEKMNGAGYPLGLELDRIHDFAKIISIVDIYDAMTAERPYHKRTHPFNVIRMFEEESYGELDSHYLYIFLERIAHNFLGDHVELSDDSNGTIIFINQRSPSRPLIQKSDGTIIDLLTTPNLSISKFL